MAVMRVVFPVPGPPVIINTFEVAARRTASSCLWASSMFNFCCTHSIAFSGWMGRMFEGDSFRLINL
jgi:hypothetical protein